MTSDKFRLDLIDFEIEILQKYFNSMNGSEVDEMDIEYFNLLKEKINNPKIIKHSSKKTFATEKATETRSRKAKEKIQNAVNILRMQDKKITAYAVAKESGVSFNTVKKYISLDEMKYTSIKNINKDRFFIVH